MRIIYPKPSKSKSSKLRIVTFCLGIVLIVSFAMVNYNKFNTDKPNTKTQIEEANNVLAKQYDSKLIKDPKPEDLKDFTGEDFQKLFDSLSYPNTQAIRLTPIITGNKIIDDRIVTIAKSRGYVTHSVPVAPIDKVIVADSIGDDLLQPSASDAWQMLKQASEKDNIPLRLNSGYRSIEMQRQLFLERLKATGVNDLQLANGSGDQQIVEVLRQAAIPGFSRHHTGYTVDFICANGSQSFKTTTCFKWLKDNNYYNAKRYGWIPSYPDGASDQGPEPEPWEYVWVGVQTLLKDK